MPQVKILIIDDSKDILEGMKMFLEMKNYIVKTVSNAKTIKEDIVSFNPDLLILDIYLSGFDGRELCKTLKIDKDTKHLKIILFSAASNALEDYSYYGADECLEKPFGLNDILEKIELVLGIKKDSLAKI
jgi:DNA-binding response OmpR family regulator